ncbi:MAG: septum formation family protein [Candidatus Planktophila sp.]|nr:septum formation family protein [Candidatus Planktophila sp.]
MIKEIAAVAVAGTIAWAGISAIDNTTRNETGQIVESGDLGAFVTKVGDCIYDLPQGSGTVDILKGVPCSEPHHWQVIHKENSKLTEYSQSALENETEQICDAASESLAYSLDDLKLFEYQNVSEEYFLPTSESWENEDRVIDCLIGSFTEIYYSSIFD